MPNISENLKRKRNSLGLTQKEFADKIGISVRALINYEQGIRRPKGMQLACICAALNVMQWELTGEGEFKKSDDGDVFLKFHKQPVENTKIEYEKTSDVGKLFEAGIPRGSAGAAFFSELKKALREEDREHVFALHEVIDLQKQVIKLHKEIVEMKVEREKLLTKIAELEREVERLKTLPSFTSATAATGAPDYTRGNDGVTPPPEAVDVRSLYGTRRIRMDAASTERQDEE